ncbi:MAG TPA: hypothetical protein VHX60_16980 [Acidobacteriaceae bacterium]|jgi:hypothetical protein|nr:hypothetical protein [Acidobacteriaceae bacterium]
MSRPSPKISRTILLTLFLSLALPALAQQKEIPRYDVYGGFANFETPWLNLNQLGFHTQEGYNWKPWVAAGFDFSEGTGNNSLTPRVLTPALQQELALEIGALKLEGAIPADYQLVVPTHAFSETFALGPQLMIRHYKPVTFFVRPSIGTIRQRVTPHPTDPVATAIIAQLVPSGTKVDWEGFYGFGGGLDWNATHRFSLRAQDDFVYWKLFDGLLAQGTWTNRFSVGMAFHFGRNIAGR